MALDQEPDSSIVTKGVIACERNTGSKTRNRELS
jgi:hypothetical protein